MRGSLKPRLKSSTFQFSADPLPRQLPVRAVWPGALSGEWARAWIESSAKEAAIAAIMAPTAPSDGVLDGSWLHSRMWRRGGSASRPSECEVVRSGGSLAAIDSAEITSPLAANLLFERICLFCFC
jgi:hypothetical protein